MQRTPCPYCCHGKTEASGGDEGDVSMNAKKKRKRSGLESSSDEAGKESSSMCIRYAFYGSTLRNGNIVKVPESSEEAICAKDVVDIMQRYADLKRFYITYYDHNDEGWCELTPTSKFNFHEPTCRHRIEVMLRDKSTRHEIISKHTLGCCPEGFFGIGIYHAKTAANFGTLWRSAYQLGASFLFTIGCRFKKYATDTTKSWTKIPMFQYPDFEHFAKTAPYCAPWIGIELSKQAVSLSTFSHPKRAVYILGAEDTGLPRSIKEACQSVVFIPTARYASFNVSVAGSIVMHDRFSKQNSASPGDSKGALK